MNKTTIVERIKTLFDYIRIYVKRKMQEHINNKIFKIKSQIEDSIFVILTELERECEELKRLGIYEKSKILMCIFEEYPILFKADKKTELIEWIDSTIDNAFEEIKNYNELSKINDSNKTIDSNK